MTAPTVTLEDVAEVCDVPRYAALVRAADEVVKAANDVLAWLNDPRMNTYPYMEGSGFYEDRSTHEESLRMALSAFNKISNGEQP